MAELANMRLATGNVERFNDWADRAMLDAAGSVQTQAYLRESRANRANICIATLLGIPDSVLKSASEESHEAVESAERTWIKENAYFRWIDEGRDHGQDLRHWREAEAAFATIQNEEARVGDSAQ